MFMHILMVNATQFPTKEIGEAFFFAQLLALSNQSGKATARQCKVNPWQAKMVQFLGLINTCVANQYGHD